MKIETKYNIGQKVWFDGDWYPSTARVEAILTNIPPEIIEKYNKNYKEEIVIEV